MAVEHRPPSIAGWFVGARYEMLRERIAGGEVRPADIIHVYVSAAEAHFRERAANYQSYNGANRTNPTYRFLKEEQAFYKAAKVAGTPEAYASVCEKAALHYQQGAQRIEQTNPNSPNAIFFRNVANTWLNDGAALLKSAA